MGRSRAGCTESAPPISDNSRIRPGGCTPARTKQHSPAVLTQKGAQGGPMAVTRSWSAAGAAPAVLKIGQSRRHAGTRARAELAWLVYASLLVAAGLGMVFASKTQSVAEAEERLRTGGLVNLNTLASADQLLPLIAGAGLQSGDQGPGGAGQNPLAGEVFASLERGRPLKNVGAVARKLPRRLFAQIKPLMVVRTPREFQKQFIQAVALYFVGFYIAALVWRLARFQGDRSYLAALHLLSGIGLCLMVSLRDPLRDTLEFHKFSTGVFLGCLLMAAAALKPFDYRRVSDWCYTPLFGALLLFGLLR